VVAYEDARTPPLSRAAFLRRLAVHFAVSMLLIAGSLAAGMAGYSYFEGLGWSDAFLNAAMLLGGEGPLEAPRTQGGKLFAGVYALYSGLLFLFVVGIMLAPVAHRLLHKFHWDQDGD
jgi:hypothetical protein